MFVKKSGLRIVIICFCLIVSFNFAHAETPLRLLTEDFPPYQYYEGSGETKSLTGISIEVVKALQEKIGNADEIKVLPWSRALKMLRTQPNTALFSTVRTPEREKQFKWVGPIAVAEVVFFKKKGSPINFTSLEEAKNVGKIGVTKNIATHEMLVNLGFENLDVMQSGADKKNLKRLLKGRIDIYPTAHYAGIFIAKEEGVIDQIEMIPNVKLLMGHLYIAFSKDTDDQIIHKWQVGLDTLRSEGTIDEIISRYAR